MIRLLSLAAVLLAIFSVGEAEGRQAPKARGKLAAADQVACTIRTMHGLQKAGGIDKRLTALRKQLKKPPFSAYKTMRLLSSKQLTIAQGAKQRAKLPTGKLLELKFKEKLLIKGRLRLRMHLSITKPKAKGYLPGTLYSIANGGTLLVAGAAYKGGTLVVGVTCKAK